MPKAFFLLPQSLAPPGGGSQFCQTSEKPQRSGVFGSASRRLVKKRKVDPSQEKEEDIKAKASSSEAAVALVRGASSSSHDGAREGG